MRNVSSSQKSREANDGECLLEFFIFLFAAKDEAMVEQKGTRVGMCGLLKIRPATRTHISFLRDAFREIARDNVFFLN